MGFVVCDHLRKFVIWRTLLSNKLMERNPTIYRDAADLKEDYCGLELYLSPEKGEQTQITSDLISEEVRKYAEPKSVPSSHSDQNLRCEGRRADQSTSRVLEPLHDEVRAAESGQVESGQHTHQHPSHLLALRVVGRARRVPARRRRLPSDQRA